LRYLLFCDVTNCLFAVADVSGKTISPTLQYQAVQLILGLPDAGRWDRYFVTKRRQSVLFGLLDPSMMEMKYSHETSVTANQRFVMSHKSEELIPIALAA
jgi:hypothetical protein